MRVFGFEILRARQVDAYRDVARAAWPLHQRIWFDQTGQFRPLSALDSVLARALSELPPEDAP